MGASLEASAPTPAASSAAWGPCRKKAPSACAAWGPGFSSGYLREWALSPKKLLKCGIHTLSQHFLCLIPFLGTKFRFPFIVLCLFIHLCMHEFIHSLFMFIHSFSE